MSYQGQTWVDEVALPHLNNGGELLVMLRVANHAGNGPTKMSGCYASAKTLAKECLMGRSTVLNHLRNLTKRGLLVLGDPALVKDISPDKRPPVYDLGGAHEPGCVGGHGYLAECQVAGAEIEHPLKNTRSAGGRFEHPLPEEGGSTGVAGAQIQTERVLKSSTKSSKELKEFSLPTGGAPAAPEPAPAADAESERESDADKVVNAYIAAYMSTAGLPPETDTINAVRTSAAALLSVGRSVDKLCKLAAELPGKGWTDLVRHAQMNPDAPSAPGDDKPEATPDQVEALRQRLMRGAMR